MQRPRQAVTCSSHHKGPTLHRKGLLAVQENGWWVASETRLWHFQSHFDGTSQLIGVPQGRTRRGTLVPWRYPTVAKLLRSERSVDDEDQKDNDGQEMCRR